MDGQMQNQETQKSKKKIVARIAEWLIGIALLVFFIFVGVVFWKMFYRETDKNYDEEFYKM